MEIRFTWVKMQQFFGNKVDPDQKIFRVIKISNSGEVGNRNIKTKPIPDSPTQKYNFLTEKEAISLVRELNRNSKLAQEL